MRSSLQVEDQIAPRHVAIIMDGNGRWAAARGLPRSAGHKAGIDALRRAVKAASEMGIAFLTIYSFSTENWSRPQSEITFLLDLFRRFIRQDVAELHAAGVRVRMIGDRDNLDVSIITMLEDAERLTRGNSGLNLVVAFNYGSQQEITRAARAIAARVASGEVPLDAVTTDYVSAHLDTAEIPPPDLLIRTGGDQRISNFLLWQSAYAEFVFVPEFWPDFNGEILARAVHEFASRERRYGGLKAQIA